MVYSQNHDQVGNRAQGDRLSTLVPFGALKLAAGLVLCAPNVPLLFMGEEYGSVLSSTIACVSRADIMPC